MRDVKTSNPKKTNEYHHNIACWANHFRENLYILTPEAYLIPACVGKSNDSLVPRAM